VSYDAVVLWVRRANHRIEVGLPRPLGPHKLEAVHRGQAGLAGVYCMARQTEDVLTYGGQQFGVERPRLARGR